MAARTNSKGKIDPPVKSAPAKAAKVARNADPFDEDDELPSAPGGAAPIKRSASGTKTSIPGLKRAVSNESTGFGGSDADGFGDDDGGFGDDEEGGGGWDDMTTEDRTEAKVEKMPADIAERVQEDIQELRLIPRFQALAPDFGGGSRIKLRLEMPIANFGLDPEQSRAWSLDPRKNIVIDLTFPPHYFMVSSHAQIVVKIGLSADSYDAEPEPLRLAWTLINQVKTVFFASIERKLIDKGYTYANVVEVQEATGVDFMLGLAALRQAKGEVSDAIAVLVNKDSKTKLMRQTSLEDEKKLVGAASSAGIGGTADEKWLIAQYGVDLPVAKMALELEGTREGAGIMLGNDESLLQLRSIVGEQKKNGTADAWHSTVTRAGLAGELAKHNYLVRLMLFIEDKVANCNKYCLVCSNPVPFVGMKPTVCGGELCKMGFEELSLGFDLGAELRDHPMLVDLYITLAIVAAANNRMNFVTPAGVRAVDETTRQEIGFVLNGGMPAPPVRGPRAPAKEEVKGLQEGPPLDYPRLNACFAKCPSIPEMAAMARRDGTPGLKAWLNTLDPLLFPLLHWILTSVRAHIRELTPDERIKNLTTEFQFVMMTSSPEVEAKFQQTRRGMEVTRGAGKGHFFAFHGSDTCNWHSILRTGLKNMSNTKFMTSGAAYGSGIYMATDSGTSLGYCKTGGGWAKSQFGSSFRCLALCEVINHPSLKPPTPYYVIPQEEWTSTRFLCIFKDGASAGVTIDAVIPNIPRHLIGRADLLEAKSDRDNKAAAKSPAKKKK